MNNIERPLDDNSTVSIHDNEKLKQVERKEAKKEKKSGITIRELTIIGLLAGITIALGLSGYGIIPLGPLNVTTLHVPTLIGAIVEGPKVGAFGISIIVESTARSTYYCFCFYGDRIPYDHGYGINLLTLCRYVCS